MSKQNTTRDGQTNIPVEVFLREGVFKPPSELLSLEKLQALLLVRRIRSALRFVIPIPLSKSPPPDGDAVGSKRLPPDPTMGLVSESFRTLRLGRGG